MRIGPFTARLLVVVLVAGLAAALWQLSEIILLLFGGVLLAIGLCSAARGVTRLTRLRGIAALVGAVLLGLLAFAAAFWVFGAVVVAQFDRVVEAAPAGFRLVMDRLAANPVGRAALEQVRGANVSGITGWVTTQLTGLLGVVTRSLGFALITFCVAIYLAAQPERYRRLVLRLVPLAQHRIAEAFIDAVGEVLRRWLLGQLVVMAAIGLLSGLGLWALGIEAAFALGLMGGMLCFIPFVGAILAAVPAALVALTQGPGHAAGVILMYVGVHVIEGNFITPMVQAEATALPPVLAILSTVSCGLLFGASGILLAAPLTLLLLAAVEVLYVQHGLGEPAEAAGGRAVVPEAAGPPAA
jgi:predicted PurR-regulated permease PerM